MSKTITKRKNERINKFIILEEELINNLSKIKDHLNSIQFCDELKTRSIRGDLCDLILETDKGIKQMEVIASGLYEDLNYKQSITVIKEKIEKFTIVMSLSKKKLIESITNKLFSENDKNLSEDEIINERLKIDKIFKKISSTFEVIDESKKEDIVKDETKVEVYDLKKKKTIEL